MSSAEQIWTRINTERDFRSHVLDRLWTADGMDFTIQSDGHLTGMVDGEPLTGRWTWSDCYFCRTAELAGEDLGRDCEIIEVREDEMRYTRNMGKGEATIVRLKS